MNKTVFHSWYQVFESLTEEEKAEVKAYVADFIGVEHVTDEKVISDVAAYFVEYVDGSTNIYGNGIPDVVEGAPAFTKKNFLWALDMN